MDGLASRVSQQSNGAENLTIRYAIVFFILLIRFGFGTNAVTSQPFTVFLLLSLGMPFTISRAILGRVLFLLVFLYVTGTHPDLIPRSQSENT